MTTDDGARDAEAGEPVAELADLAEAPSDRFLSNVLDGIQRRQATAQALEFSWWGLTGFVAELLQSLFRALGVKDEDGRS